MYGIEGGQTVNIHNRSVYFAGQQKLVNVKSFIGLGSRLDQHLSHWSWAAVKPASKLFMMGHSWIRV